VTPIWSSRMLEQNISMSGIGGRANTDV
jgi:hypothetical protein